jgi:hypothetical protein
VIRVAAKLPSVSTSSQVERKFHGQKIKACRAMLLQRRPTGTRRKCHGVSESGKSQTATETWCQHEKKWTTSRQLKDGHGQLPSEMLVICRAEDGKTCIAIGHHSKPVVADHSSGVIIIEAK